MVHLLKVLFSVFIILIVLTVGGISIFIMTFDFSRWNGVIAEKSEEIIGRPIVILGKIRPAFNLKNPTIIFNDISLKAKKVGDVEISAKTLVIEAPKLIQVIKTGSWKESIEVNLKFVDLNIGGQNMGRTNMSITSKGLNVDINPLSFKLFKANFLGKLHYSANKNLKISGKLSNFDYGQFSDGVEGKFDANLDLTSKGDDLNSILNNLNGKVLLTAGKGKLAGRAIDLWASDFLTSLLPIPGKRKHTNLICAVGLFDITKGQAASRIIIDTDSVLVKGKGNIDIPNNILDLKFKPKPKKPSLLNMATPLHVTGNWADPSIKPTAKGVLTKIGGLLLGAVNPAALALPFLKLGSKDENPCLKMLTEQKERK